MGGGKRYPILFPLYHDVMEDGFKNSRPARNARAIQGLIGMLPAAVSEHHVSDSDMSKIIMCFAPYPEDSIVCATGGLLTPGRSEVLDE